MKTTPYLILIQIEILNLMIYPKMGEGPSKICSNPYYCLYFLHQAILLLIKHETIFSLDQHA